MIFSNIKKGSEHADLISNVDAFMFDGRVWKYADDICRKVCGIDEPFGGKSVFAFGDIQQTPPVTPGGTRAMIVSASLKKSFLWGYVRA